MYLMFWSPSKTDAKTCPVGAINASVRASITKLVFSRPTCPIHTTTPKNQVWVCIAYFGHLQKLRENAARWCIQRTRSCADYETCVFAQTCRIHSIPPKNQARVLSHVLVSFKNRRENVPRRCIKCPGSCADYETCVFAPNMSNPHHCIQKPSLGMYSIFGHLQKLRENAARWCIKRLGSCADYETCVFTPNMSNPLLYTQKPSSGFISCFGQLQKPPRKRAT